MHFSNVPASPKCEKNNKRMGHKSKNHKSATLALAKGSFFGSMHR